MKIKVSCILLAAGMSTRMSIGNKLLLSVKGKTIIEKTLEQLNKSKIYQLHVVLGFQNNILNVMLKRIFIIKKNIIQN